PGLRLTRCRSGHSSSSWKKSQSLVGYCSLPVGTPWYLSTPFSSNSHSALLSFPMWLSGYWNHQGSTRAHGTDHSPHIQHDRGVPSSSSQRTSLGEEQG